MSISIRSPICAPGSPQNHSTFRSAMICFGRTPNSAATSSTRAPSFSRRYGTNASSRCTWSRALLMHVLASLRARMSKARSV
jgi:hypothetical protein